MARLIVTVLLTIVTLLASDANVYERNCVKCHKNLSLPLEKFFFDYLLKYSSERRVKQALENYLRHPRKKASLSTEEVLLRYGLMPKSTLSNKDLEKAIDIYWERNKVFGKIE